MIIILLYYVCTVYDDIPLYYVTFRNVCLVKGAAHQRHHPCVFVCVCVCVCARA
jgi:hypothetical protein